MAVELYRHISATRTGEGKLWTSTTGIDHLGNDWALIGSPFDFTYGVDTLPSTGAPSWSTRDSLVMTFPADYALDDDFDALEVAVGVTLEAFTDSGSGDAELRLESGGLTSNVFAVVATSYAETDDIVLVFPSGSEPTGQTTINIQAQWVSDPGAETLSSRRALAKNNCFVLIRKV